jgi:hypothetical protein
MCALLYMSLTFQQMVNMAPTMAIKTLREREYYFIHKSQSFQSHHGRKILVWLHDDNTGDMFKVHLPQHICRLILDHRYRDRDPDGVSWMPYYKMACYGMETLNNGRKQYDIRFLPKYHDIDAPVPRLSEDGAV